MVNDAKAHNEVLEKAHSRRSSQRVSVLASKAIATEFHLLKTFNEDGIYSDDEPSA
jgi:hypothetical protein